MSELKPCPFCGEENTDTGFILHKDECYLMLRYMGGHSKQEMINAWNTRPIEDALRDELEKRTAELHYANTACMEMKRELDRLNAEIKTTDDLLKEATETDDVVEFWKGLEE